MYCIRHTNIDPFFFFLRQKLKIYSESVSTSEDISPWFHSPHHILNVLSDLISGLQTKEVEVPQKVVVKRQELEIQLW